MTRHLYPLVTAFCLVSGFAAAASSDAAESPPPSMPHGIVHLARASTEPAYTTRESMLSGSRTLQSEIARLKGILEAAAQAASRPASTDAWKQMQPAATKGWMLLQRIVQIENSKPGNLQTLMDGAELIEGLNHDSENATTIENLKTGVQTFQAAKGLWDRIAAESDLADLRRQYRAAQTELRNAALHLHAAYDRAMGSSVGHHGFIGLVLKDSEVADIVLESSAQLAGVRSGDRILQVNGQTITGMETQQIRSLLMGRSGTSALVTFAKAGAQRLERRQNAKWSLLGHDYHASMNGAFFADHLTLTNNTTRNLTNCLIRVRRLDAERKHVSSVHYCASWRAGERLHFAYRPQSDFQAGTSFDDIDTIDVSLISEQLRDNLTIDYGPAARAADYGAQFSKATLSMSRKEYVKGMLWDDHRGVRLTLDGVHCLSPSKVTVTLHQSGNAFRAAETKSLWWKGSAWHSGASKTFTSSGFDHLLPDGWKVELEFPHTTYRQTFAWGTCK